MSTPPSAKLEALVGDNAKGRLWIVDLETSPRAGALVRWKAAVSIWRFAAARRQRATLVALVHAPGRDVIGATWPNGVHIFRPLEILTPDDLRQVQEWVHEVSQEFAARGPDTLFPEVAGVHLGQLNRLGIQCHLTRYRLLSSAAESILRAGAIGSCRILSADPWIAASLRHRVLQSLADVASWSPSFIQRVVDGPKRALRSLFAPSPTMDDRAAREAARRLIGEGKLGRLAKAPVLLVSDSKPMAEMFEIAAQRLNEVEVKEVVRIDYTNDGGIRLIAHDESTELAGSVPAVRVHAPHEAKGQACVPHVVGGEDLRSLASGIVRQFVDDHTFDRQAGHLYVAAAILEGLRPGVVVVGNDRWWLGQAFVRLARQQGIPSLSVQDGLASDDATWWWMSADRMVASGRMLARMLRQHGIPNSRIVVAGQPRYDRLHALRSSDTRRSARRALELDDDIFTVLFATGDGQAVEYRHSVVAAIMAVPDVHLLLRPHPADPVGTHTRLLQSYPSGRISLCAEQHIAELLCAADVLVTQYSTVALEAVLLGKTVLTTGFPGIYLAVDYAQFGIATRVGNPQELTQTLQRLAKEPRNDRRAERDGVFAVLEDFVGPIDGHAGRRVAMAIKDALGSRIGADGKTLLDAAKTRDDGCDRLRTDTEIKGGEDIA